MFVASILPPHSYQPGTAALAHRSTTKLARHPCSEPATLRWDNALRGDRRPDSRGSQGTSEKCTPRWRYRPHHARRSRVFFDEAPQTPVRPRPIRALSRRQPPIAQRRRASDWCSERNRWPENTTTYQTTGQGARLDVGGRLCPNGFQVNTGDGSVALMWPTHDRYTTLSAQIGMDGLTTSTSSVATFFFVDSTNTRIPFTHGKLVFSASVPATGFLSVTMPIAHLSEVLMSVSGRGDVVDVVNDHLS